MVLNWAIVGTGAIAERFCRDMLLSRSGRVVAVASRDRDRARAFASRLGPDAVGDTLDGTLARSDIQAVYVASPTAQHRDHALAALAARKPVMVEKPLAASANEAEEIADASRRAGVLCMEAMWMRFTPGIRRARRLLDAGQIGEPRQFDAHLGYANPFDPASRLYDPFRGGGAHLDLGVYPLSLAFHLLGAPIEISLAAVNAPNGVPSAGGLVLTYPNAVANLGFSFLTEARNEAYLSGTTGRMRIAAPFLCPPALGLRPSPAAAVRPAAANDVGPIQKSRSGTVASFRGMLSQWRERPVPTLFEGSGLQYQADHFADLLAAGATDSPIMPIEESIAILRILDRFRPSSV